MASEGVIFSGLTAASFVMFFSVIATWARVRVAHGGASGAWNALDTPEGRQAFKVLARRTLWLFAFAFASAVASTLQVTQ